MILTDFNKAFDTLDHDIFLDKMKYLGFTSKNRLFWFPLKKNFSETGILNCGVPQGSILGPILFLLHVNKMKTALKNCDLRLYKDDTCIPYRHQNVKFIERN